MEAPWVPASMGFDDRAQQRTAGLLAMPFAEAKSSEVAVLQGAS
jgi:hypothetical protein